MRWSNRYHDPVGFVRDYGASLVDAPDGLVIVAGIRNNLTAAPATRHLALLRIRPSTGAALPMISYPHPDPSSGADRSPHLVRSPAGGYAVGYTVRDVAKASAPRSPSWTRI